MTSALVGIPGAFIGFHIGVILGLLPSPLMYYLTAVIGAFLVLWYDPAEVKALGEAFDDAWERLALRA